MIFTIIPIARPFARYIREYSRQLGHYQIEPDSEALRLAILELNNTFHFITDHAFDGQSGHFDNKYQLPCLLNNAANDLKAPLVNVSMNK